GWTANGLGKGYSSVSVAGENVYTLGDHGDDCFVIAISRANGKQLWSTRLGQAGASGWGGFEGPRSTPSVAGNLVVALGLWGEVLCVDAASGREIWRKDLTKDFGAERPEWGFAESPLIDAEKVVLTPGDVGGAIVALNQKTGAVIWRSKGFYDPAQYSSVIIAEIGGV